MSQTPHETTLFKTINPLGTVDKKRDREKKNISHCEQINQTVNSDTGVCKPTVGKVETGQTHRD